MIRTIALLATVAFVAAGSAAAMPAKTITGTVGPSFEIRLTQGGKHVTKLKAGTYRLVVDDIASLHDFHLVGPGVNKVITGVGFEGTRTIAVRLKKGVYSYMCDPHAGSMHGTFTVV